MVREYVQKILFTVLSLLLFSGADLTAGEDTPTLSHSSLTFDIQIDALSEQDVRNKEDVLFEVRLENLTDHDQPGILWFDVNLTGLENVKPVLYPNYTNMVMPIEGTINARDVLLFQGNAWPLEGIPRGLYIFWAKIGRGVDLSGDIVIDARSSFHGTILGSRNQDEYMPENDGDGWMISSIRPMNDAARKFMAGKSRNGSIPKTIHMIQNYPNPFNPSTSLTYEISPKVDGVIPVKLEIYNIRGRLIRTLVDQKQQLGLYTVGWDGRDQLGNTLNSGIYIFKLQAGAEVSLRKGVLSK